MRTFDAITAILVVVGALNWGLVGFANFDLVQAIFGHMTFLSRLIYALVGISGLYQAIQWKAIRARGRSV